MQTKHYDRAAQDIGNIVNLGHVNICISDQHIATHYYVTGLGLTRDPFLNTGAGNMWINVGMSQFHLPTGTPEILRGVIGLVVPDRQALLNRLSRVRKTLADTKFEFRESNDCVETVCPWGNRIHVHAPDKERFGRIQLGMPYVRFDVRPGTVRASRDFIARCCRRRPTSSRTAPARKRAYRSAKNSISIFVRPMRRNARTTVTTCRFTSPIFPVRIGGSRSLA